MPRVIVVVFCLFFFLSFSSVAAHEQVVVVPLNSSKKLANIITVAKSGGDFTNPVAAVASITDASGSNSYLVVIGPGSYTLTEPLIMKRNVSIAGSGRNATTLTGYISSATADSSSAIVVGAQFTQLSDITIVNRGGGYYSIGFYSYDN
ncbi:MAG: hypothetical protein OEM01_05265, partial [Desulfobulbaceae bacterium]|nr:hypothetical protein [Desulfobulbaceae bacterium]